MSLTFKKRRKRMLRKKSGRLVRVLLTLIGLEVQQVVGTTWLSNLTDACASRSSIKRLMFKISRLMISKMESAELAKHENWTISSPFNPKNVLLIPRTITPLIHSYYCYSLRRGSWNSFFVFCARKPATLWPHVEVLSSANEHNWKGKRNFIVLHFGAIKKKRGRAIERFAVLWFSTQANK